MSFGSKLVVVGEFFLVVVVVVVVSSFAVVLVFFVVAVVLFLLAIVSCFVIFYNINLRFHRNILIYLVKQFEEIFR